MMKIMACLVAIVLLLLTAGCGKTAETEKVEVRLYDLLDSAEISEKTVDFPGELTCALGLTDARYIVYITDVNCSSCVYDYMKLSKFFVKNTGLCDTVVTVAYGGIDFLTVDYYMNQYKDERIANEKRYVDNPKNSIVHKLYGVVPGSNMFLVEDHRVIFSCDSRAFNPDDEGDLKCVVSGS